MSGRAVLTMMVTLPLVGCGHMMGESFTAQDLRNPRTGATATCVGHAGRGEASKAELETMNACISWYLSQGFTKIER